MVTMQQVQNGVCAYVDREILPKMSGLKKIGLGAYMALAANNLTGLVAKYLQHPAVEVLDVVDVQGNVDIDKIYNAVAPMFTNGTKHSIDIPFIGPLIIDAGDIDKLHQCILRG